MTSVPAFSKDVLRLDAAAEADRICAWIGQTLRGMRKRGVVVAFSGGIDSSVVGALAARAVGAGNVYGIMMPEEDSSAETDRLGRMIVEHLGVPYSYERITPVLEGFGCYKRRDEAIRAVIPEYASDWKHKIVLPPVTESDQYRVYSVVAQTPDGRLVKARLPLESYLQIVAATNFKQRTRKTLEYFHADRLNYAVAGTPNLLEYDQGFFVKLGDGAADLKPIAHLYKTQVYQMAEFLGVPADIRQRQPTTDTYSLAQSQEEFYFSLPYAQMDLCLYARTHEVPAAVVAPVLGLTPEQVERVYRDIDGKRRFAHYLHLEPQRLT
uniref:NH(3)-dependent NAD(+) synthetase n=1 Tax=uncultured bacterium lac193 TaxID=1447243 RepID=X2LBT7_9BACT|nr:NAD synthetase [uncultured bacterium lac193]